MEQDIKRKIFITGANGFIGRKVTAYLANLGYQITAVVRQKKWEHENVQFIEGDLFDIDNLKVEKSSFDAVVHMAAYVGMYEKNGKLFRENYELTKKILDFFENSKVYFIYFSSIEAFGPTTEREVRESDIALPVTDYGKIKLKTEQLVATSRLEYAILRVGNVESEGNSLAFSIRKINQEKNIYSKIQKFILKNIIADYEINIISTEDIGKIIEKIIEIKPKNQIYFAVNQRIKISDILKTTGNRFKIFLPAIISGCRLAACLKLSHIIVYLTEGGISRRCRNYSNEKITKDLSAKLDKAL